MIPPFIPGFKGLLWYLGGKFSFWKKREQEEEENWVPNSSVLDYKKLAKYPNGLKD